MTDRKVWLNVVFADGTETTGDEMPNVPLRRARKIAAERSVNVPEVNIMHGGCVLETWRDGFRAVAGRPAPRASARVPLAEVSEHEEDCYGN